MAFKGNPVVVGDSDTLIYECPVGTEAVAVLGFVNSAGSAVTYTVKVYKASLDDTFSFGPFSLSDENEPVSRKFDLPLAMEGGDQILAVASTDGDVVAFATVTQGDQGPQFTGFTIRGEWQSGTTYAVNDVVFLDGTSYASREADNQGNDPSSSPSQWAVLAAVGAEWRGDYDSGTTYEPRDMVRDGGAIWRALQETTGNAPPSLPTESNAYWQMVVKDGELTWALVWSAAEGEDLGNLTGTVELDFDDFLGMAHGIVTGNVTLGEPSNAKPGQTGTLDLVMDATGGWTLAVNDTYWVTEGGEVPEWDDTADARNILGYQVLHDGKVFLTLVAAGVE